MSLTPELLGWTGLVFALAIVVWPSPGMVTPVVRTPRATAVRSMRPARLRVLSARRRGRHDDDEHVSAFLTSLAPTLASGVAPLRAAEHASDVLPEGPVRREIRAAVAAVDGPGPALAASEHHPSLALVGRVWCLSDRTGAPLAAAVRTAELLLRERIDRERAVEAGRAQAAATIRLLTGLPLTGPLLALAVGVDPAHLYHSAATWASLALGLALVALGHWWSRAIVTRVLIGEMIT